MDFPAYCSKHGIHLLRDDIKFIRKCLNKIPKSNKRAAMLEYITQWHEGMQDTANQNKGRYAANQWLLQQTLANANLPGS